MWQGGAQGKASGPGLGKRFGEELIPDNQQPAKKSKPSVKSWKTELFPGIPQLTDNWHKSLPEWDDSVKTDPKHAWVLYRDQDLRNYYSNRNLLGKPRGGAESMEKFMSERNALWEAMEGIAPLVRGFSLAANGKPVAPWP